MGDDPIRLKNRHDRTFVIYVGAATEDAQFVLYRGQRETEPSHILVVAPLSKQPAQGTFRRLEHEYALRIRLDPACAVVPLALVRDNGRIMLVLEDPGGEPSIGCLSDSWT